ncbi:hypothetical protein, partial [uncultured Gammaproteobacteria bacterium]
CLLAVKILYRLVNLFGWLPLPYFLRWMCGCYFAMCCLVGML